MLYSCTHMATVGVKGLSTNYSGSRSVRVAERSWRVIVSDS